MIDRHNGFFALIGTVFVAVFTGTLWKTTDRLVRISNEQRTDLERSINAAERAALATELNVEALVSLESPIVVVTNISMPNFDPGKILCEIWPIISIKNYGRTPAFVDNVLLNIAADYPREPRKYRKTNFHPDGFIIEPGKTHDYVESSLRYMPGVDLNVIRLRINSAAQVSTVYGVIFYRDFMNRKFEKGFIRAFSKGPGSTENYAGVHPKYDYRHEVDKYTEYP